MPHEMKVLFQTISTRKLNALINLIITTAINRESINRFTKRTVLDLRFY